MTRTYLCEFGSVADCERGIVAFRDLGARNLEAYLPFRSPRIEAALAGKRSPLPLWTLLSGIVGALAAYGILYFTQNVDYPLDVGGRPTHAVAAYVPITFETTMLFASVAAFAGALVLCGLPRLHHPIFTVPGFERASVDRFFVTFEHDGTEHGEPIVAVATECGALRAVPVNLEEGAS
ncbi:MAG TPA: DUF3341 domain-containing protein [Polyangiaceae bacterium]|nr:DUF3341 domain-containing protein [Polyangiaceae bacterium]